ncbi:LysR family transcriptional regulator [Oscillatoria sp. CS-180]|uniref:LysR family transcriptional regulator n=1 Tax=Oscillatoria sp. CS-180 TaxID=3021720 RepID=UPI00232EBDD2|nr:LysR family transcriptional regulator [Oscillatoria sp. CS-180]MDB9529132.1 LysR family transcriptional regulator [Oscillatoria sp. CS-180]
MSKGQQSGPRLSQIRALVAVARFGSFGEAALQLGLTQPTVSHAISTLEDELGIILLVRGRHGAQLTPAGKAVAQQAEEVLHLLTQMQQTANLHKGLHGGEVRISTFRGAAANLLPPIVAQFRERHPAIAVTMLEHYDFDQVEQQIRDGKADIGITFLPTGPDFETYELMRDPFWVLLPPDVQTSGSTLTWEQVTTLPLMTYPEDNSCFVNVHTYFREAGFDFKPQYQFRETSTILSMVAQGLGAAIIPSLSAHPVPPGVGVVQLPSPLERTIAAILLAAALHPPSVFAFLQTLQQYLED